MICHPKRELRLLLILIIISVFIFQRCFSVSLALRGNDSAGLRGVSAGGESPAHGQRGLSHAVKQVTWTPSWDLSSLSALMELQSGFKPPTNSLPPVGELKPDKTSNSLNLSSSMWTTGKVREERRSAAQGFKQGYQADFTGFSVIQGKVLGLSSGSSPYFSEWEAMRPLVKCADDSMTFHASGQGFTHLQVDRKKASPISIFQLPSYCSYVVKASRTDLEMMVPYDDCYIIQENGSHVLPMLWLGSPLRLSCPITASTVIPMYSLPAPTVFCSADSMAVQVQRQEHSVPVLGVIVAGTKDPFVSERCAFQVDSEAQKLTYLISNSAPCITTDDGLHLPLTLDDLLYVLSCPVPSQIPYAPSLPQYQPLSHGDPLPLNLPHLISPVTTTTPNPLRQASGNEQSIENPHYQKYYSGFQYQQLPQTSPRALQTLQPTIESIHQYSSGSEPLGSNPRYLSHHFQFKDNSAHELPDSPSQDSDPAFYTYVPFFHQELNPAVDDHHKPPAGPYYPQYYHQKHYPVYTVTPVTQAPASPSGLSFLPKGPLNPQHHSAPFNPMSFYHQQALSYSASHPVAAPPSGNPDNPIYPTSQSNIQTPFQFLLPPHLPLVNQETKKPSASHGTFYPANYHKLHPLFPHYPKATSPTVTPKSIRPEKSIIKCLEKNMVAFLPFADSNTIQIKDPLKSWESISSASPFCGYMLQMTGGLGVILHSPLPACHSHLQTPTTISLPVRYWDFSTQQNRTLDLECPYQITPDTPTSTPWDFPTPPSTTKGKPGPSVVTMTEVFCSFQQMKVVLPPGPISEIVLKDTDGNQMSLHESPKECGYYASEAKDGKIHLFLQLHSHCHMSVQDQMYIISILYTTPSGRKEAKVSCPIVNPRSEHECNLHSEYRLPCGSSSISQTQCLSMGCCFNKHPPACYYPMDECTIDRHMIFSVPASLTDPPLSTALLVAANNSTCKPQRVTPEYALFNIPMDGCGTRRVMVGKTVVYMVEITNIVQTVRLNYGTITRDSPIRLLVECRYVPGTALSVSYVVKTPTFGPEVHTRGVFGVQLRIAKDAQYSSYYPQYHQPLHMLLGKPLHLEVRLLNSPDPSLVLLVHFCVAYPRSGKAVWVLLYNGCPNPLDPAPPKTVLSEPTPPSPQSQTRRFTIRTFQFLPDGDFQDTDEERDTDNIIDDSSHPHHGLLSLLPSGKRLCSIRCRTSRFCNSFFPTAIRLLNC